MDGMIVKCLDLICLEETITKGNTIQMLPYTVIASQVPVYRLVIFGKKSDSATGLTIKSTMLNGTGIHVTPYEPITITGLQPNQPYIFVCARIDDNGMLISYTVTTRIVEDSQQQSSSPVKSSASQKGNSSQQGNNNQQISGSSDGGSRNVLGPTTAPIVTCYPLPVVSLLSQFATSAWRCGQLIAKANRFRVMRRVSIGDSPGLARLECIGPDGRNTQVAAYLVKNALTSARIVYRYAYHHLDTNLILNNCSTLPKGSVAGAGECGAVIGMFDGRRAIRGCKSGSGMQTLSGSGAGGLEETEVELLSGAGMGVGASIDELLAGKQQGKGSCGSQFNKWKGGFITAFIQQLIPDIENGQKDGFAIVDEDYLLDIEPIVGGEDDDDEQNFEFSASAFSGGYSIQLTSSLNSNCSTLYPNSSPFQLLLQSFQAFCVAIEASLLISNYSQILRFCQQMLTTLTGSGLFSQLGRTHPSAVRSVVVMVKALKMIPQPKLTGFITKTFSNQKQQYEQQNSIISPISSYPDRIPSPQSNTSQSPLYTTPQLLAKQQQQKPQPNAESIDATLKAEYSFQAQSMIAACLSELVQCDQFPQISRNYAAQQIKVR
ncbi:MAG: hypothetical protein EZS28_008516 [Streblomastix strix]|uniref:Uncharacterized protein n=1 Tax=Streblomastix strix TaxID=222440 RepID=A0A5J4WLW1_9EUKA|nr:MAG: hypothetical protein EZS28_008516 [Streblomastix strix]